MKNLNRLVIITGISSTIILFIVIQFSFVENPKHSVPADAVMQWAVPVLPEQMNFAGEKVPIERRDVHEQFDREWLYIYYQQSNNIYILKLINRYFPLIEERLKQNNIPEDFKYLCIAESNLQNLVSRAGAVGFWQFMKTTAPGYSIEVNAEVDERYNVLVSTDAACKYLQQAYNKFGSWTAAAASYNCGQGGYSSRAAMQQTSYYYDLYLPEETNKYIYRILSFKYLIENASSLGYNLPDSVLYKPFATRTFEVTQSIENLSVFAKQQGTTYKVLRLMNPWIRGYELTVKSGKSYTLQLPAENNKE